MNFQFTIYNFQSIFKNLNIKTFMFYFKFKISNLKLSL